MKPISIGICAYNEEKNIEGLLDNLLTQQGLSSDSEIIIVCSGCTDKTPEIVQKFCEKDKRVKLILEPMRKGKIEALNRILSLYCNKYFVNIDADHIPAPGTIPLLISHFEDPSIGLVSGIHIPIKKDGFVARVGQMIMSIHNSSRRYFSTHHIPLHYGDVIFAIRKGICNYIPNIIDNDSYIGMMCEHKGFRIYLEEKAYAFFQTPGTMSEYVTQRVRFTCGMLELKKIGMSSITIHTCGPKNQFNILTSYFAKNLKLIPYFIVVCILEVYINLLARLDIRRLKSYKVWRIAESTKSSVGTPKR